MNFSDRADGSSPHDEIVLPEGRTNKLLDVHPADPSLGCPFPGNYQCGILRANEHMKRSRDEAVASSRSKNAFLADVSHELRTPLTAIIGYSEGLYEGIPDEWAREDLLRIREAGQHLLYIINDILDMAKIEANRVTLYPEAFSVEDVCYEAFRMIEPELRKSGNQYTSKIADGFPLLFTDRVRVRQLILNLLSNATKFTRNGTITLVADYDDESRSWSLCVHDTGIGISAEDQARLFTEFTRLGIPGANVIPGTGLGLALTRRLCQLMGGDITVTSKPGSGSSFCINLPIHLPFDLAEIAS